jgi:hypothetical protein
LLLTLLVLAWALAVEPALGGPHRPRTLLGVVLAAVGTLLHAPRRPPAAR